MLKVGEQTGTLDKQLQVTANFYEVELQHRIKRLTSLFEPAVIVVMGVIVGFVALALVSAMYGIFNQVKLK
jgi:type IV pilus assembly protein PilC